jgi:serine/threonine protein kinase
VTTIRVNSPLAAIRGDALLQALREATLGEYEVLGELGRGGMATVYLGHDIALDRKVAIKVMSPTLMAGEGMAERFKREARTAGQLSHPHIIPIYAVREHGDLLYFVMKFIGGRSLDSIIREIGPLPIPMVQTILQQVGSALGYAHRRGVIHRDVKPANVMLDSDGWAVVTDFGIAKVSETQGLTVTGATVGTPSYMSPEQCAAKELTGASDQYSLGVVAYEMLSGRLPFVAESVMAVMYAHFNEPPPPVSLSRPDCPPVLAEAVMRMLEKDPAHRFPSMEAATAAAGAAPLAPDDPIRTQMITLAAKGESMQLLERFSTPISNASAAGPATSGRQSIATLLIAPPRVSVAAGESVQLHATAKSRLGKTLGSRPVSWASTNTDVARVAPNGLVTAVAPGTVTITVSSDNTSATAVITVVAGPRPARRRAIVGGMVVLGALAGILIVLHPFGRAARPGAPPGDSLALGRQGADTQALAPAPTTPTTPVESSTTRPAADTQAASQRQRPPAAARDSSESTVATALAGARSARAMAVDAGAAPTDLAAGDLELQQAADMRRTGRRAAAFGHLRAATALFATAESTAAAAKIAAQRRAPPPDTASKPAPPPPVTPAPVVVDPEPAIRQSIAAYVQALENRDMTAVTRVFPDIPSALSESLRQFFRGAEEVHATWQALRIAPSGSQADARIAMTLTFKRADNHTPDRARTELLMQLSRRGDGWIITSIH